MNHGVPISRNHRLEIVDWLKAWAILAVVLDHLKIVPEPFVVWSVNIFVLVTAAVYSMPGYVFSLKKLMRKFVSLVFIYWCGIIFFDAVFGILHDQNNRNVVSVLLNPFYMFVKNPYLGDVWYLGLHVQILILFYFFLKYPGRTRVGFVLLVSALISQTSFFVTHYYLERFKTIFVTSWLFFLAIGFFWMAPFIERIRIFARHRFQALVAGVWILCLFYACFPFAPLLFQNENRASLFTLPLYLGLVLFLAELFYLFDRFPLGSLLKRGMSFTGRYTLAIYLTHQAFFELWNKVFDSNLFLGALSLGSGILFGMITDRLFMFFKIILNRICRGAIYL